MGWKGGGGGGTAGTSPFLRAPRASKEIQEKRQVWVCGVGATPGGTRSLEWILVPPDMNQRCIAAGQQMGQGSSKGWTGQVTLRLGSLSVDGMTQSQFGQLHSRRDSSPVSF